MKRKRMTMERYYELSINKSYTSLPRMINMETKRELINLDLEQYQKYRQITIVEIKGDTDITDTDILLDPIFMVNERIYRILQIVLPDLLWRSIILNGRNVQMKNCMYYFPYLETIEIKTKYTAKNIITNNKVLLNKEQVKDKEIFRLKNINHYSVIVRENILECMLALRVKGIDIKKIEME